MKNKWLIAIIAIVKMSSCTPSAHDDGLGHHHNHGSNNEQSNEIILNKAQAVKFGVYTQMVKPTQYNEVVKVSGQIVSAPGDRTIVLANSSGIVNYVNNIVEGKKVAKGAEIATITGKNMSGGDINESQRIAFEIAKREYERVSPLFDDGIISEKEYNDIKLKYEQAKIAYTGEKHSGKIIATSSGIITQLLVQDGEFVNAGQSIAVLSNNVKLTLRADVPEKYYNFIPTIKTANFKPSYVDSIISIEDLNGQLVSTIVNTSAVQPGYIPVYFTFDNNGIVIPGSYADVYLIGASKSNAIVLPIDAIVEQQGNYFVYVKLDEECYEKRLVKIGNTDGEKIEILSGLSRKDEVVTRGAVIVKLAESSGAVPEGHSHNH